MYSSVQDADGSQRHCVYVCAIAVALRRCSLGRVAGEEPDTLAVRDRNNLRTVRLREYVHRTA